MSAALLDMATSMGVAVEYARLRHRDGEYRHDLHLIRLRHGMTARMERSTLAHEIGHAVFEDGPTPFGPVRARQERRADEWAALHLITPETYRAAEGLCGGHVPTMAYELGVIGRLVIAYQHLLARIGDLTYLHARMGAGQWDARVDSTL